MKVKNLLLCGAVCTLLTGYAQEAIRPEIKNLSSPVVDADARSITFNLSAPNAKSVVLSGNILRGVTDTLPDGSVKKVDALKMNKNEKDGIWTVTVKDIAPDLYTYKFIADGLEVVDPLNAYVVRDVKMSRIWYTCPVSSQICFCQLTCLTVRWSQFGTIQDSRASNADYRSICQAIITRPILKDDSRFFIYCTGWVEMKLPGLNLVGQLKFSTT